MADIGDKTNFYLEKTFSQNPSDVAHLLKYFYYSNIRFDGKYWYRFIEHHWKRYDEDNSPLIPLIKNDIVNKYLTLANSYNGHVMKLTVELNKMKNEDPSKMETYLPLIISDIMYKSQQCSELAFNLTDHIFYQRINLIAQELFTDKEFPLLLDTKLDLVGFENGNFNLETGILNVPKYSDMVFSSVGYDFQTNRDSDNNSQKEVEDFFQKLGLSKLLPLMASMLSGRVRQPLIWIKGFDEYSMDAFERLLHWCLGDYLGFLPFSTLRKRKIPDYQNHTHTNLVQNCRKRIVMVKQTEEDFSSVYPQMIDTLLCDDVLNLRNPYEMTNNYIPQFGLIIMSLKHDCDPLEGSLVFEAISSKEKIKIKEEWKYGLMKLLLNRFF